MNLCAFRQWGKKIVGFGKTYRDPTNSNVTSLPEPVIFLKPTTSYVIEGESIKLPRGDAAIEHEVELGVVIGKTAKCVEESRVTDEYIGGYALALDMTDRHSQRTSGLTNAWAKGFDTACPVSGLIEKSAIPDSQQVGLWLKVNGTVRQQGNTANMMYSIPYLISWLSQRITLEPGDLILTGTPTGSGPVKHGDLIECGIDGVLSMTFPVEAT